jgi:hypothetical protein
MRKSNANCRQITRATNQPKRTHNEPGATWEGVPYALCHLQAGDDTRSYKRWTLRKPSNQSSYQLGCLLGSKHCRIYLHTWRMPDFDATDMSHVENDILDDVSKVDVEERLAT